MGPQKQHQTARASSGMRPGRYIGRWGRVSGSCGSRAAFSRFLNDVAQPPLTEAASLPVKVKISENNTLRGTVKSPPFLLLAGRP